jgi:ribonuclease BN (tRNA processing enzyme)
MNVTIVGSGCGIPNAERRSPCIVADTGTTLIAIDCGPGALWAMDGFGVKWAELGMLFVTHFHTDHIADIGPLLFSYNIPDVNRTAPLKLCGPPGLRKLYENLVAAYGEWLIPKRFELTVEELEGEPVQQEKWRVEIARAEHSEPAYAYRFEAGGASMVYSGDTGYAESIIRLASDCDLLILECSYPNDLEVPGHLSPRLAGEMARLAGCAKLVLTHLYPVCADYDMLAQCRQTYDGEVLLAEDGMRFEFG